MLHSGTKNDYHTMKDSPIYFTDERWEKIESDLLEIKTLLKQLSDKVSEKTEPKEEILNSREVARLLSVDVATIYSRCAKGAIPHFRIGKQYKFRLSEINAWLEKGDIHSAIDVDQYVNEYLQKHTIKG